MGSLQRFERSQRASHTNHRSGYCVGLACSLYRGVACKTGGEIGAVERIAGTGGVDGIRYVQRRHRVVFDAVDDEGGDHAATACNGALQPVAKLRDGSRLSIRGNPCPCVALVAKLVTNRPD